MPVYEYFDKEKNRVIELHRPVAERDLVSANLARITVPQRLAIHGTTSSPIDEASADGQVPNGLKALSNNQANAMIKESGFSRDKFKRTWGL